MRQPINWNEPFFCRTVSNVYELVRIDEKGGAFPYLVRPIGNGKQANSRVTQVNEFGIDILGNQIVKNSFKPKSKTPSEPIASRVSRLEKEVAWLRETRGQVT